MNSREEIKKVLQKEGIAPDWNCGVLLASLEVLIDHAKAQAWLEGYNAHTREDDTGISAKNPYSALSLARKEEGN